MLDMALSTNQLARALGAIQGYSCIHQQARGSNRSPRTTQTLQDPGPPTNKLAWAPRNSFTLQQTGNSPRTYWAPTLPTDVLKPALRYIMSYNQLTQDPDSPSNRLIPSPRSQLDPAAAWQPFWDTFFRPHKKPTSAQPSPPVGQDQDTG